MLLLASYVNAFRDIEVLKFKLSRLRNQIDKKNLFEISRNSDYGNSSCQIYIFKTQRIRLRKEIESSKIRFIGRNFILFFISLIMKYIKFIDVNQ